LAYFVKSQFEANGQSLDNAQLATLTQAARIAKERLLNMLDEPFAPVALPGRGSRLVGGTLSTELKREDLERVLLDGFFPQVPASARPTSRARRALTQLGLPYAQAPAIPAHLAAFWARQASALGEHGHDFARPT